MTSIKKFQELENRLRKKYDFPGKSIFTVSGLSGSGTSTIAKFLAEEFKLELKSGGEFFREEARKRGLTINEFLDRTEEIKEKENLDFDLLWDKKVLKLAFKEDELLIESRLAGAILYKLVPIRIYVSCNQEIVAERVAERENLSKEEALKSVKERDEENIKRYKKKYDVDPTDKKYYNVVVDNSGSLENTKDKLINKVNQRIEDKNVDI